MSARSDPDLDADRTDLVLAAAVGTLLMAGDALTHELLLDLVERALSVGLGRGIAVGLGVAGVLGEDGLLDRLGRVLTLDLVDDLVLHLLDVAPGHNTCTIIVRNVKSGSSF